jgi:hypothetical protein
MMKLQTVGVTLLLALVLAAPLWSEEGLRTALDDQRNSTMLAEFVRDADGGVTLHVQLDSPGKAREPSWLPAPEGPFVVVMRLYWPEPEALDGTWKQPRLERMQ